LKWVFVKDAPTMPSHVDILLVEDEPAIVDFMERMLRRAGYTVRAVMDGAAALAALKTDLPAVLILDLALPSVSGWTVLDHLRRVRLPVPVIVVTANPHAAARLTMYGIERYLVKPFGMDDLLDAVASSGSFIAKNETWPP
jgi:two-component system OmpR family response regulator